MQDMQKGTQSAQMDTVSGPLKKVPKPAQCRYGYAEWVVIILCKVQDAVYIFSLPEF
jgi:hypothetical protein